MEPDRESPEHTASLGEEAEHWGDWLGRLLWDVSTRTSVLCESALAGTPLSLSSLGVLDWIAERPGITIAEITRRSPTTQQAISQVVARLQKLGFVSRKRGAGRSVGLYLTDAGCRVRAQGNEMRREFELRLQDALGKDHHERLRALLGEMRARVIELEEDGGRPSA